MFCDRRELLLTDLLIWSSWVRTELTTLIASDGSVPDWQEFLAAVRLSTYPTKYELSNANMEKMEIDLKKKIHKSIKDFSPHQSEQKPEHLYHQSVVGSSETSLLLVCHSVKKR